jgi:hypothetical protein
VIFEFCLEKIMIFDPLLFRCEFRFVVRWKEKNTYRRKDLLSLDIEGVEIEYYYDIFYFCRADEFGIPNI